MYVNVAVLKETQPHERRVALMPSVVAKMVELGAEVHMQSGAADAIRVREADYDGVMFVDDRSGVTSIFGDLRTLRCRDHGIYRF